MERVETQPLTRPRDRIIEAPRVGEQVDHAVEQRRPLASDCVGEVALPVVERRAVAQSEPREQVVAMELARLDQSREVCGWVACDAPKRRKVEPRALEIERDGVAVCDDAPVTERGTQR